MASQPTALKRIQDVLPTIPEEKRKLIERSLASQAPASQKVKAFHTLYDHPIARQYETLTAKRMAMRVGLILEELQEFFYKSMGITMLVELEYGRNSTYQEESEQAARICLENAIQRAEGFDPVEGADAMGDMIYVIHGLALELGIDMDAVVNEIHASNMTKLGPDGRPMQRPDGKTMKGPNYIPPNIAQVLDVSMQTPMDPGECAEIHANRQGS